LQNKTDSSFLDLAKSKEKEESVGRDHTGSSLGDQDTKQSKATSAGSATGSSASAEGGQIAACSTG